MAEFRMPSLGADMEAGRLVEWHVRPGDRVKRGDVIASVETDKGFFDIEIFEDGIVDRLIIQPSEKVPVGTVLATIRAEGEPFAPTVGAPEAPPAEGIPAKAEVTPGPEEARMRAREREVRPKAEIPERVMASPSARKLAAELGIDLGTVRGTGPHGAVQRADVERVAQAARAAAELPPPPPEKPTPVDFQAGMRRAIAAAMSRSNREIPHYYLETCIDMSNALRWMEAENLKRSIRERLLPVVLLLKGVARALKDVPELNGYWIDDRHRIREDVHIGFAISLRQGGLITPAIHHVDRKSPDELMEAIRDLITRTREGRLRSSEVTDATITVTSLGDLGVETVYGVIYPPQVALVGFGRISERPWAENGMLGVRRAVTATLAADHRATDGHYGARFLKSLHRHLQSPEKL